MSAKTNPPAAPAITDLKTDPAPIPATPPAATSPDGSDLIMVIEGVGTEGDPEPDPAANPAPAADPANPKPTPADRTDPTAIDPDAPVFMFGDEAIPVTAAAPAAAETAGEKELREQNEVLTQRLAALEAANPNAPPAALTKPDLWETGIDGDAEKYEAALENFYDQRARNKVQAEQAEQVQNAARTLDESIRNQAATKMDQQLRAAVATFPDILQADQVLGTAFQSSPSHALAFLDADLSNPEMVAYALYKKPELLAQYLQENNPVRLGKMLNDISAKVKMAPKGAAPEVHNAPKVNGSLGANPQDEFSKLFPDAVIE